MSNIEQKIIVFIGYRKPAIEAAQRLGYACIVWSDKTLTLRLPKNIIATHIAPYPHQDLDSKTRQFFNHFSKVAVIPITEAGIVAAMLLKQYWQQSSDTIHAAACHDKWAMKLQAQKSHIPVTEFALIDEHGDLNALKQQLNFPMYIKLRDSSGARGQHIVHNDAELKEFAKPNYLAEKMIQGMEMSFEVFVQDNNIIFLNPTQYYLYHHINIVPASPIVSEDILLNFAEKIVAAYGIINGILHIEIFITSQGLILGEFAARPPGGYIMNLLKMSYGFDPWESLIKIYLHEKVTLPRQMLRHSAVYLIHPGPGKITKINCESEVRKLASFHSMKLKKHIGDVVTIREGSGQDIGAIFFQSNDLQQLIKDIDFTLQHFTIEGCQPSMALT